MPNVDPSGKTPVGITGLNTAGAPTNNVNADALGNLFTINQDVVGTLTALGALNATVALAIQGAASVGFQINAGTLIGTITAQYSMDGGTSWKQAQFYDSALSTTTNTITFSSANALNILSVLPGGGASNVRVIVTAYTSGTAQAFLRASQISAAAGAVTAAAFGTIINTTPTLTSNTATQVLASNSNRKYACVSNNTGFTVSMQMGTGTGLNSTSKGIVIPTGNFYEFKGDNLYTGAIFIYTQAGGTVIGITEGTP